MRFGHFHPKPSSKYHYLWSWWPPGFCFVCQTISSQTSNYCGWPLPHFYPELWRKPGISPEELWDYVVNAGCLAESFWLSPRMAYTVPCHSEEEKTGEVLPCVAVSQLLSSLRRPVALCHSLNSTLLGRQEKGVVQADMRQFSHSDTSLRWISRRWVIWELASWQKNKAPICTDTMWEKSFKPPKITPQGNNVKEKRAKTGSQ